VSAQARRTARLTQTIGLLGDATGLLSEDVTLLNKDISTRC
jgi:hypothetical protein